MCAATAARNCAARSPGMCARSSARTTAGRIRGRAISSPAHGMHDGIDKSQLGLKPRARRSDRGPDLRVARRGAAGIRRPARAIRRGGEAAGIRSRADRQDHRLRSRGELEARLGEQPRMLPLRAVPPAVREGELRRLRRSVRVRGDPAEDGGRGRARGSEMGGAGHRDHACEGRPGAVSRSGPQHVVRRRPHGAWSTASTPSRWTASASRR